MNETKLNSSDLLVGGLNNATKIVQKLNSKESVMKLHWCNTVIVNLAEKLFLQVSLFEVDFIRRRYSYRNIQEILQEDYQIKIAHTTIFRWAKKHNWEKKFKELQLELLSLENETKTKIKTDKKALTDEKISENI